MSNKYIFSLTTIPNRINYIYFTINSLFNQSLKPYKVILNIPKKYNLRFDYNIDQQIIDNLHNKYNSNLIINLIDEDYGPGSKLLGLFKNNILDKYENDAYIVLVDDDVIYKPFMLQYFDNYNKLNKNSINIASFFCYENYNILIGQGCDGFFIKLNELNQFEDYYNLIKNNEYINYHDDFYISYFFYIKNKKIDHIKLPYRNKIYILNKSSQINELHTINNKYNRDNLTKNIYNILSNFNMNGKFNFLK